MEFPGTPVIILGMGRSGTSYLASFLASLGVDLGSKLLDPSGANPRGFFEDSEIVEFHRGLLRRFRAAPDWDRTPGELLPHQELTAEDKEHALRIVGRLAKPGLWGWKDPRTIHFIGFWLELLPESKLVVPLRHPLEILYSYLKRIATIETLIDIKQIFRAYVEYHDRILSLVQERPNRSLVVYSQNILPDRGALRAVLEHYLDLPQAVSPSQAPRFEESEFTRLRIHREAAEIFAALFPEAAAAFDRLTRRSQFSFSPCQASPGLQRFSAQLAAAIGAAGSSSAPESWLPLLIDLCRSADSPGYFALQAAVLTRHSEAAHFWKAQSEALTKEVESHVALLREQSERMAELEEAQRFWIHQADSRGKELETHAVLLKEQSAWIAQLEEAKQYWIAQADRLRK